MHGKCGINIPFDDMQLIGWKDQLVLPCAIDVLQ
jgi:hypothetical protein